MLTAYGGVSATALNLAVDPGIEKEFLGLWRRKGKKMINKQTEMYLVKW